MSLQAVSNREPTSLLQAVTNFQSTHPGEGLSKLDKPTHWYSTGVFVTYNENDGFAIKEMNCIERLFHRGELDITKFIKEENLYVLGNLCNGENLKNEGCKKVLTKIVDLFGKSIAKTSKEEPTKAAHLSIIQSELENFVHYDEKKSALETKLKAKAKDLTTALAELSKLPSWEKLSGTGLGRRLYQQEVTPVYDKLVNLEDEILIMRRELEKLEGGEPGHSTIPSTYKEIKNSQVITEMHIIYLGEPEAISSNINDEKAVQQCWDGFIDDLRDSGFPEDCVLTKKDLHFILSKSSRPYLLTEAYLEGYTGSEALSLCSQEKQLSNERLEFYTQLQKDIPLMSDEQKASRLAQLALDGPFLSDELMRRHQTRVANGGAERIEEVCGSQSKV